MFLFRENGINFGLKERLKGTRERNKIVEKMDKYSRINSLQWSFVPILYEGLFSGLFLTF